MKIVVLEADALGKDVGYECLEQFGEVVVYGTTTQEQIVERIKDADIIVPNKCVIGEDHLAFAPNVKLICEAATGYNNIDLEYCRKQGITVTNVAGYSTDIVAQHTFALLLNVLEKMDYYTTYVEDGEYSLGQSFTNIDRPFHELAGKQYGIIGLGNIGRKVAQIATAFGCKVVYYSASGHSYDVPYERLEWEEFLATSDIISVHAPLNEYTNGLLNREAFAKMKKTAIVLNLGRGPIVVEEDLKRALDMGDISAAGLDVFEQEPLPKKSPLLNVLERDRLIMTPHIGWGSVEARHRLLDIVASNIRNFLEKTPTNVVS